MASNPERQDFISNLATLSSLVLLSHKASSRVISCLAWDNVNLGSGSVLWLGFGIFFVLDLVLLLSVKEKSLQFHLYFAYNLYYTTQQYKYNKSELVS